MPNIEAKNPGVLRVPADKNVEDLPQSHFEKLVNDIGYEKVIRALINLEVWNKNKNKSLSSWASNMADKLKKKFKGESTMHIKQLLEKANRKCEMRWKVLVFDPEKDNKLIEEFKDFDCIDCAAMKRREILDKYPNRIVEIISESKIKKESYTKQNINSLEDATKIVKEIYKPVNLRIAKTTGLFYDGDKNIAQYMPNSKQLVLFESSQKNEAQLIQCVVKLKVKKFGNTAIHYTPIEIIKDNTNYDDRKDIETIYKPTSSIRYSLAYHKPGDTKLANLVSKFGDKYDWDYPKNESSQKNETDNSTILKELANKLTNVQTLLDGKTLQSIAKYTKGLVEINMTRKSKKFPISHKFTIKIDGDYAILSLDNRSIAKIYKTMNVNALAGNFSRHMRDFYWGPSYEEDISSKDRMIMSKLNIKPISQKKTESNYFVLFYEPNKGYGINVGMNGRISGWHLNDEYYSTLEKASKIASSCYSFPQFYTGTVQSKFYAESAQKNETFKSGDKVSVKVPNEYGNSNIILKNAKIIKEITEKEAGQLHPRFNYTKPTGTKYYSVKLTTGSVVPVPEKDIKLESAQKNEANSYYERQAKAALSKHKDVPEDIEFGLTAYAQSLDEKDDKTKKLQDYLKSEHTIALKKIKNHAANDTDSFYKGYATAIHEIQRKFGL